MTQITSTHEDGAAVKALYIGGHGKVGLLATPKLIDAGIKLDSLIRKEEQVAEIESLGARAVVRDVTTLNPDDWAELVRGYDVVVWGAGNGGRGGADVTWAVDRDAALALIDGLEQLEPDDAPRLLMISYMGATKNEAEPGEESWYAYVESKKAVDNRLNASDLDFLILGPATLTDEPAEGIQVVGATTYGVRGTTSRELVADVVTQLVARRDWPDSPLEFVDGGVSVTDI